MAKFRNPFVPEGHINDEAATAHTDRASMVSLLKGILKVQLGSGTTALKVAGQAADGAAVAGNPVRIAGKDGSGNTQDILTDTSGELQVDVLTVPALATGTNTIGAVKDAGPNWTKAHTHVASADASAGVELSAAPTGGQKIVLVGLVISTITALTITIEDETAGTDQLVFVVPANSQPIYLENLFLKLPVADKKLILKTSGAGQIYATATYFSEA